MKIIESIYTRRFLLLSIFVISTFVSIGSYYLTDKIGYKAIKSVRNKNLSYNNHSGDIYLSIVKEFSEFVKSDYKEINISFYAKVKSISRWNNIFQTAPLNSGIRMELSEPATLGLVIKKDDKDTYRGFYLTRALQLDKWYLVNLEMDLNKRLIVLLDNQKVIDEVDPKFDYEISEIAVGSGFSKTRPFDGELSQFEVKYSFYKKNVLIFSSLSGLKMLSIMVSILCVILLIYPKVIGLFKLASAGILFLKGIPDLKIFNFLSSSTSSFLFIIAVLIFYSVFFSEWLYDQVAFVDSYAYLGHILNPFMQRNGFPKHASGDVLPAIFPGYLFHAVFPAIFANFIYKILLAATTTFLLFRIIQKYFGLEVAILSILVTLTNSFFLASMGSYYVLSIVIFYLTSVLFFIVKAGENKTKWRFFYLGLIGFSLSCMMSSAVLTVVFTPGFLILYYGLKKMEKGRLIGLEDVFIPLGFVLGILLFCFIHYSYTNTFIYFHSTIGKILGFLSMNRTPGSLSSWIFKARWLGLSAIILFYSLLKLTLAKEKLVINIMDTMKLKIRPENLFIIICNVNFISLAYLQLFRNQGTISDPYYFSQGIPIVTLGLISIFYKEYQVAISKSMVAHISIGLLCLLIGYHFQSDLFFARLFYLLCAIIFISAVLRKADMIVRSGLSCIFLGSIVALSLILSHVPGFGPKYTPETLAYIDSKRQKAINLNSLKREYFLRSVDWFNLVNEIDPLRKTLMWYDRQDPYGKLFIDLCATSHIWQGGLINQQFPLIDVPENDWTGPTHIAPKAGMEILILTSYKEQKLTELSDTLRERSLKFIIIQNLKFNHGFAVFDVLKIKLLGI